MPYKYHFMSASCKFACIANASKFARKREITHVCTHKHALVPIMNLLHIISQFREESIIISRYTDALHLFA